MHLCRANLRLLAVVIGIAGIAACNALVVPLLLEGEIGRHWKSPVIRRTLERGIPTGEGGFWSMDAFASSQLRSYGEAYRAKSCQNMGTFKGCVALCPLYAGTSVQPNSLSSVSSPSCAPLPRTPLRPGSPILQANTAGTHLSMLLQQSLCLYCIRQGMRQGTLC